MAVDTFVTLETNKEISTAATQTLGTYFIANSKIYVNNGSFPRYGLHDSKRMAREVTYKGIISIYDIHLVQPSRQYTKI